jgi:CO/xanthine dehydrogenase FAD-binding subunit
MTSSYLAATTVEEALEALGAGARPVAGGTDLVVGARQGKAPLPESLVAIHGLDGLRGVEEADSSIRLGALATHADLASHPIVVGRLTALADASARVGSHATRAQGTIGGNLMNASPAMETGGPLMVFGATVSLRSATGERRIAVADLATGPGRTVAEPDELLTGVEIRLPPDGTGSCYARLEYRRHMEIAVVGATAAVTLAGGTIQSAAVAITALAPTIRLVPEAADALVGTDGGQDAAEAAASAAAVASEPISDVRASADYRRAMTDVLTRRVVGAAVARARGENIPVPASETLFGLGGSV